MESQDPPGPSVPPDPAAAAAPDAADARSAARSPYDVPPSVGPADHPHPVDEAWSDKTPPPGRHEQLAGSPPSPDSIRRGYEFSGVGMKVLYGFVAILIGTAVVLHVGLWFLQKDYLKADRRADRPVSGIVNVLPTRKAPPLQPSGPLHDTTDRQDLANMLSAERRVFTDLGWVDPNTGDMRVPDDVVDAVARRRAASPATAPGARGTP